MIILFKEEFSKETEYFHSYSKGDNIFIGIKRRKLLSVKYSLKMEVTDVNMIAHNIILIMQYLQAVFSLAWILHLLDDPTT